MSLTTVVFIAELIAGVISGSLSLLADAAHMLSDSAGLIVALTATLIGRRVASGWATYGHKRVEVLAAALNAGAVSAISVWIVVQAISRIGHAAEIKTGIMLAVATIGLLVNAISALILMRRQHDNMNLRGAYLHVLSDLLGSVAVIIAGVVIQVTGFVMADIIASFVIACLILPHSVRLLGEALRVLLNHAPSHVNLSEVRDALLAIPGVQRVHDLHVWSLDGEQLLASCHLVVPARGLSVQPFDVLREASRRLKALAIGHSTIQIESSTHQVQEESFHESPD